MPHDSLDPVCEVMKAADISGTRATPKGVRHVFGIKGVTSLVPHNMIQKWLGHAKLSMMAFYLDAVGCLQACRKFM
jgi:integrase